jgi:hypothetical protein
MRKAIGGLAVTVLLLTAPTLILTGCGGSSGGSSSSSGDSSSGGSSGGSGISHHAGQDCVACHATLESNKRYVYAGTVYANAAGTAISAGSVVEITESSGAKISATTDNSGNFYTTSGTRGATYNATVKGNKLGMTATATNGGCSTCHGVTTTVIFVN